MQTSQSIQKQLLNSSWIRKMFEEGARLKRERGAENVFDFSLGNPDVEPPAEVAATLAELAAKPRAGSHGYMMNAGYEETRAAVARQLEVETGVEFRASNVIMTTGSAGACNVVFKSILDPGDEVIVLEPSFSEYRFYISNHGGVVASVQTDASFAPDIDAIARAITPRTRAIMLNSPNNPTGRVYPAAALDALNDLLERLDQDILVLSDEPYKHLVYDGRHVPEVAAHVRRTVICNSWSKSLALPGERIGYLAVSPRLGDSTALMNACTFSNRILGFINAPAIWQRVVERHAGARIDIAPYQEKRDLLCAELARIGYDVTPPEGTFFVFPKTPIADDIEFVHRLARHGVLGVPGTGFGRAGYFRLSLTVPRATVEGSLEGFRRAFEESR
jgi:aspartate aminotransferase